MTARRFTLLLPFVFLISCSSKDLSRNKAAELIKKARFTPPPSQDLIFNTEKNGFYLKADMERIRPIEKVGWITINIIRQGALGDYAADVALTPAGVEQSRLWIDRGKGSWAIPTVLKEFVAVTGITSLGSNMAGAEYTYRWVPTDSGKKLGVAVPDPFPESATFQLFDDGWRIHE